MLLAEAFANCIIRLLRTSKSSLRHQGHRLRRISLRLRHRLLVHRRPRIVRGEPLATRGFGCDASSTGGLHQVVTPERPENAHGIVPDASSFSVVAAAAA